MAINSRAKGKQGELEACQVLREMFGFACRRTQQYSGWGRGGSSPDIECEQTPDLFWEIKRVQALNVPRALGLAIKQSGRRCPVLMHRTNRSPNGWMITIRLSDLPRLCHAFDHATHAEATGGVAVAAPSLPGDHAGDSARGADATGTARAVPRP